MHNTLKRSINRKVILENYEKYKNPSELILDSKLKTDEKIVLLKEWLEDEESLSRATDEGLVGDNTRSDILKQVKKALITMENALN